MADIDVTSDGEERVSSPAPSPKPQDKKQQPKDKGDESEVKEVKEDRPKAAADYLTMLGAHHEARLAAVDTATAAAAAAAAVLAWCPALMPPWCQLVPAWCRPTPIMHHNIPTRRNKNTSSTGLVQVCLIFMIFLLIILF